MNRTATNQQIMPSLWLVLLAILATLHGVSVNAGSSQISQPAADVSGTYSSVVTTKRGKRRSVVKLVQNGNEIIGTWDDKPGDKIVGIRSGDTIVFEWFNKRAGYDLKGTWKIKGTGIEIEGTWERPDGASGGNWRLEKID